MAKKTAPADGSAQPVVSPPRPLPQKIDPVVKAFALSLIGSIALWGVTLTAAHYLGATTGTIYDISYGFAIGGTLVTFVVTCVTEQRKRQELRERTLLMANPYVLQDLSSQRAQLVTLSDRTIWVDVGHAAIYHLSGSRSLPIYILRNGERIRVTDPRVALIPGDQLYLDISVMNSTQLKAWQRYCGNLPVYVAKQLLLYDARRQPLQLDDQILALLRQGARLSIDGKEVAAPFPPIIFGQTITLSLSNVNATVLHNLSLAAWPPYNLIPNEAGVFSLPP